MPTAPKLPSKAVFSMLFASGVDCRDSRPEWVTGPYCSEAREVPAIVPECHSRSALKALRWPFFRGTCAYDR